MDITISLWGQKQRKTLARKGIAMALTRKPRLVPESESEVLIAQGGSVAAQEPPPPAPDVRMVPLRIEAPLLARIDRAVQAQPIKIPRNTWILQAILEKLERDG